MPPSPSSSADGRCLVSIVVPALNENGNIVALLEALHGQDRRPDEVLVVDGCSADGTGDRVEAFARCHPELHLRLLTNPTGTIPAALNVGVRAAQGQIVIRIDAHACPRPDYVRRSLEVLAAAGADVVGGRWQIRPGRAGPVAQAIAIAVGHPLGAGDARYRLQPPAPAGEVDTVPYGCFRRSLWERLGGFNERLLTNEDYEFNYRVRLGEGRVYYDPAIESVYPSAGTLPALWRQYFRYGWWKAQMLRYHPRSIRRRQFLPLAAFAGLAAGLLAVPFAGWYAMAGLAAFYAGLVGAAALRAALGRRAIHLLWALPLAFAALHFAWSLGGWANLVTGGRWPDWRARLDRKATDRAYLATSVART